MPLRWMLILLLGLAAMGQGQEVRQPGDRGEVSGDAVRGKQIRRWLAELADPQGAVRERAREELMGLGETELASLRAAIKEAGSLEPGQSAVLKEIVTQVYLASRPYEKSDKGFVGIVMPGAEQRVNLEVVVESRLPGFAGYRWLRDGDAILNIEERPQPQPMGRVAFTNAISAVRPGTVIHLKVLRQGKVTRLAVRLDARPAARVGEDDEEYRIRVEEMMAQWGLEAETYWRENFAPLMDRTAKDP